ncbi:MAG: AbrB/MazE/SpoVT family DNA-binding domain-containing protein [Candidatus Magasanikbacteria bacterium]
MTKKDCFSGHAGDFFGTTSIGERGQIVMPKKLRDKLKLKKGDSFVVMQKGPGIVFMPTEVMEDFISDMTLQIKNIKK